ncbi:uncharacterized protein [Tenebrio molitor]|uniref:uncharacterized protein isoform X2 n=1 Tax=Tenebrio molitor TaxID=7067 RepID=UPI0036247B2E
MRRGGTEHGSADIISMKTTMDLDICTEMNRSLSLFFIISKVLAFTALIMLFSTNDDAVYHLLTISVDQVPSLEKIPNSFRFIILTTLFVSILVCTFGIYGYARMNRYAIAYYGTANVLKLMWLAYMTILIYSRDDGDQIRKRIFAEFKYNKQARSSVEALQINFHCCGSPEYQFEDLPVYPPSCCAVSVVGTCLPNTTWPRCETNRTTVYTSLRNSDVLIQTSVACLFYGLATVKEIAHLSFHSSNSISASGSLSSSSHLVPFEAGNVRCYSVIRY